MLAISQWERDLEEVRGTVFLGSTNRWPMIPGLMWSLLRVLYHSTRGKDQSDTGWLLAHLLHQDGVRRNAPSLRQHPSRVAGGLLSRDASSAGMRGSDVGLNDEHQLVHDSRAHAAGNPDADLERGSILFGGVVTPSHIQDGTGDAPG